MSWTATIPTTPGLYGWRLDADDPEPQLMDIGGDGCFTEVAIDEGAWRAGSGSAGAAEKIGGEWWGPITLPWEADTAIVVEVHP